MGVGKSTIGKKLARELGYDFVDLDILFEEKYKISIEDFFAKYGEELFREFENKILLSTFDMENTVVATGGGTPCHHNAIDAINLNGISVFLEMPAAAIVNRLENSIKPRPLVKGKTHEELQKEVEILLTKRTSDYEKAQMRINALGHETTNLAMILRSKKYKKQ